MINRKKLKRALKKLVRQKQVAAVGFVLLVAVTGAGALLITRGATPSAVSVQPESGSLTGATEKGTDQNASGGSFVQFNAPQTSGPKPVNANATTATVKLYQYLKSLPSKSSHKVLSGQHMGSASTIDGEITRLNAIKTATGEDIALWGFDTSGVTMTDAARDKLKAHWDAGGIITMSDHAPNPVTGQALYLNGSANNVNLNYDIDKMLTQGTNEWTKWHQQMDKQAANLKKLGDVGVSVIWRPYHEMNCAWWWWTFKGGPDAMTPAKYIKLYREMYTYMTNTKGINNVLWTWAPHLCDTPKLGLDAWYPGDAYVDIVGIDDYSGGAHNTTQLNTIKNFIAAHSGKIFAFTELGAPGGDGGWNLTSGTDNLLGLLQNTAPQTTYYLFWNSRKWRHADQVNYVNFLKHNLVANRDDTAARDR